MANHTITITDVIGDSGSVVVTDPSDCVSAIRGWFPDADQDINDALDQLDELVRTGDYNRPGGPSWDAVETFLGISVDLGGQR